MRAAPRPPGRTAGPTRAGVTWIEVLVVLSVTALVASLLLPAIFRSRQAATRSQCQNNLRQLAVATQAFETTHGRYPQVSLTEQPHAALLPFLDQQPIADALAEQNYSKIPIVPQFVCELDACRDHPSLRPTSYGFNAGTDGGGDGPFNFRGGKPSLVKDGLTTTAAFAEITSPRPETILIWRLAISPLDYTPEAVVAACGEVRTEDDEPVDLLARGVSWITGEEVQVGYNHLMRPNMLSCILTYPHSNTVTTAGASLNAAGPHPGGVNVAFLDGRVERVADDVAADIWTALGSVAGAEVFDRQF